MWEVKDTSPFESLGYFVRDRRGAEHWVVATRATFDIHAGGLVKVSETQEPVRLAPEYADSDSLELSAETDICPFRPRVDFLVQGVACLPGMKAATHLTASVTAGSFTKRASVFGERAVKQKDGRLTGGKPEEFGGIRLTWRNALGGADPFAQDAGRGLHTHNPIGTGWAGAWEHLPDGAEIALPHIENPDALLTPGRPQPQPHGFGAIQPHWRPRRDHAGTYDAAWQAGRAPLLPDDFDDLFYQSAPAGQQLDLKGGEQIRAENLHPDGAFEFRLPQIILEASTRIGSEKTASRFKLISVSLDTERKRLGMVWNTLVACNGRDHLVEGSTVSVKQMAGVAR